MTNAETNGAMNFQLRRMQESDLQWVRSIYQNPVIMRHIGDVLTASQVHKMFGAMLQEMTTKKAIYYVIHNGDENSQLGLCSMQWQAESQRIVSGMIITPEMQNKGVCKWAQMTAMQQVNNYFPAVTCSVYINTENLPANTSYKNMGFVQVENDSQAKHQVNLNRWDFNMEKIKS